MAHTVRTFHIFALLDPRKAGISGAGFAHRNWARGCRVKFGMKWWLLSLQKSVFSDCHLLGACEKKKKKQLLRTTQHQRAEQTLFLACPGSKDEPWSQPAWASIHTTSSFLAVCPQASHLASLCPSLVCKGRWWVLPNSYLVWENENTEKASQRLPRHRTKHSANVTYFSF